ncbi:MAG: TIGR03085 family metal-binding protein [Acidimicrobiales bacterium]
MPRRSSEPLDARERRELCDLLEELGPDAPTLCEGWTTADLASHLVVRERNPTAAPGILLGGSFAARTLRFMDEAKASGYRSLVDRVRNGPPFGPFAVPGLRTLINLQEYVIHHEDVRRANGLGPRTDRPDLDEAIWGNLRRGARLLLRKVHGATVGLQRPGGDVIRTGRGPEVLVTGEPVDLLLYLFGRDAAAQVDITGDAAARKLLAASPRGI